MLRISLSRAIAGAILLGVVAVFNATIAQAAFITPNLPGTTQFDAWTTANISSGSNAGFPSYPGSGAWPNPIGSGTPSSGSPVSGDATANKTANGVGGGPFPSSGSIYFGGFSGDPNTVGGTLSVADLTPVTGLANIVFQIDIAEAFGYDFQNHVLPKLNYNGGSQAVSVSNSSLLGQVFLGTFDSPTGPQPIFQNTYLLQWNVTGLGITSFDIGVKGVQHAQIYAMQLDQSNVFAQVPEPTTLSLAAVGMVGLFGVYRRVRNKNRAKG